MKNLTRLLTAAFAIGVFCTMTLHAQMQAVNPIKGVGIVVKHGQSSNARTTTDSKVPLTFCWPADGSATNVPSSYKVKAWLVGNLQNARQAVGANQPVVETNVGFLNGSTTSAKHAINTKGAGANDRSSTAETDSDSIKACAETIVQADGTTQKYEVVHPHNGGVSSGKLWVPSNFKAVTIDDFPACAKGSSCDYAVTVEALDANGKPTTPNATPETFTLTKTNCCWDVKANKKL